MKKLLVVLPLAALAATVAFVAFTRGESDSAVAPPAADPAHTPPAQTRVLVVSRTMPEPSSPGMTLHGRLVHGAMPHAQIRGTVLTDSECTPDMTGISHCRNEIRLADGSTIAVRHPHDMADVPCLSPGEHVFVRPS